MTTPCSRLPPPPLRRPSSPLTANSTTCFLARNHQFLGVNRAVEAVRKRKTRALGVFWHTQGAGKSYSMVIFTRKVHRKLGGNFTFLVLTDRDDLDSQIYKTFVGCDVVNHDRDPCRASDGRHLSRLLAEHKAYVFSLIQKFNENPSAAYTQRDDITLKAGKLRVNQWCDKEATRDAVRVAIHNFLWSDETGLPSDDYSQAEVETKTDDVFRHVFRVYPTVPSPYYENAA